MKKIFGKKSTRHPEFISGSHESEIPKQVRNDVIGGSSDVSRVRRGFTLAETLITLMIIGVVAVLVIPAFITNINKETLAKQQELFSKKFTEGLSQMRVDGVLNQKYETTEEFVAQMQKYFKINNVCNNTDLSGCFPENFTFDNDVESSIVMGNDATGKPNKLNSTVEHAFKKFSLTTAEDGAIKVTNSKSLNDKAKYETNVMGVVFADGVQMLLYVNPDCIGPEESDKDSSVTSCINYLADVNQSKSPNKIGTDIASNIVFVNLDFEIYDNIIAGSSLDFVYGEDQPYEDAQKYGFPRFRGSAWSDPSVRQDYWGSAIKYCKDLTADGGNWRLMTANDAKKLADLLYASASCTNGNKFNLSEYLPSYTKCQQKAKVQASPLFQKMIGDSTYIQFWISDFAYSDFKASYVSFASEEIMIHRDNVRNDAYKKVICVR